MGTAKYDNKPGKPKSIRVKTKILDTFLALGPQRRLLKLQASASIA